MNEKDKKSLIIISSVFVFALVFMVFFTFYRRDAMLSDRTVPRINTNTVVPEDDPPALGDTCGYSCPYGSVVGNNQCCSSGYSYDGSIGTCVLGSDRTKTSSPTSATYSCSSCSAGKYLRNSQCYNCPNPNVYCPGGTESYIDLPQNSTRTEDASGYLCNAGYFADGTGCTECPAGKYRDEKGGVGLSSCATCKSNYYSEAGATSCTKCVNGSSSNSNKTACICENGGKWTLSTNTCGEGILECGAGYYYNNKTDNCESCPSGKYCVGGDEDAQPQTCSAGTYAGTGASKCSPCDGVTEYSSAGAERCSTCSGVVDSGHTTCTPCPTNSTAATNHKSCVCNEDGATWNSTSNTCTGVLHCCNGSETINIPQNNGYPGSCVTAGYSDMVNGVCSTPSINCGKNMHANPENTSCVCNPGYYKDGNSCAGCPEDSYCPGGGEGPNPIPDNGYGIVDDSYTYFVEFGCLTGYYKDGNSCAECPENRFCPGGSEGPQVCPDGYVCGLSTYTICPKGWYCKAGTAHMCPAGTYNDKTGKSSSDDCLPCDGENEFSVKGSIKCSVCEGPANDTHTLCLQNHDCLPGYFKGQNGCEKCPAGFYCPDGVSKIKCSGNSITSLSGGEASCDGFCINGAVPNFAHTDCVVCDAGYVPNAEGSECVKKPTSCPAGQYFMDSGSVAGRICTNCPDNTYTSSENSLTSCTPCPSGSVSNSGHTGCVTYACYCNPMSGSCTWATSGSSTMIIQPNVTSSAACTALSSNHGVACYKNSSGKYVWGDYGSSSGYTYVVSLDRESCLGNNDSPSAVSYVLRCPASVITIGETINCTFETSGSATLGSASSSNGSIATAGKSGNYVSVEGKAVGTASISATASDGGRTNSVSITVIESSTDAKNCEITSVTTNQNSVSLSSDGVSDANSYYIIFVNVSGNGCRNNTLTVTASNATVRNGNEYSLSGMVTSTGQYSFHAYPDKGCDNKSVPTAKLSNGKSKSGPEVTLLNDWSPTYNVCVSKAEADYTSFLQADIAGASVYYSNWNGSCYTIKWTRGCGGGSSNPSHCYRKLGSGTDNQYQVATSSPGSGWSIYYGDCSESPACYLRVSDGARVTGKYKDQTGYTPASSCEKKCYIKRATSGNKYKETYDSPGSGWEVYNGTCSESPACYKKTDGSYVTGLYNGREGYTKVEDSYCQANKCYINKTGKENEYVIASTNPGDGWEEHSGECNENEACYKKSDNSYVTGKYNGREGYTKVEDSYCQANKCYIYKTDHGNEYIMSSASPGDGWEEYDGECSENNACYKYNDGSFIYGRFDNRLDYTKVDDSDCNIVPDIPQTSMDVKTIVYIAVAIMSVVGLYFVVKYNNESKNI